MKSSFTLASRDELLNSVLGAERQQSSGPSSQDVPSLVGEWKQSSRGYYKGESAAVMEGGPRH